jgi:hypothetical protein
LARRNHNTKQFTNDPTAHIRVGLASSSKPSLTGRATTLSHAIRVISRRLFILHEFHRRVAIIRILITNHVLGGKRSHTSRLRFCELLFLRQLSTQKRVRATGFFKRVIFHINDFDGLIGITWHSGPNHRQYVSYPKWSFTGEVNFM